MIENGSGSQGGPPPCFLDGIAFQTLANPKVDTLNMREEKDLTQSERQILDKIKIDIASQQDMILKYRYTGPIDMAHINDIVRSVTVSLINKYILHLPEFKERLSLHGIADIVTNQPKVRQHFFVKGQLQNVDANYLFRIFSSRLNTTKA